MGRGMKSKNSRWLNRIVIFTYLLSHLLSYVVAVPVSAEEQSPTCGVEEHIHTEACYSVETVPEEYVLSCTEASIGVHIHNEDCYDADAKLICGKADYYVHEHTPVCFEGDDLVCQLNYLEAHTHSEDCFELREILICSEEEMEGVHSHGQECYASVSSVVCGKDEVILHTHSESCYDEDGILVCPSLEVISHIHSESCLSPVTVSSLTCQIQEHTHTDACYSENDSGNSNQSEPDASVPETTTVVETTSAAIETTSASEETTPTTEETISVTEDAGSIFGLLGDSRASVVDSGTYGDIDWVVTEGANGYIITFSGEGPMKDYVEDDIYNKNESSIEYYSYRDQITDVIIDEGITHIGDYSFGHFNNLSSVTLPSTLESIGRNAFRSCYGIKDISIPDGVESIGSYAFSGTGLTQIVIPDSVSYIADSAFYCCYELVAVTLPQGYFELGEGAFSECGSLRDVRYPIKQYFAVGRGAFRYTGFDSPLADLEHAAMFYTDGEDIWYKVADSKAMVFRVPDEKTPATVLPKVGDLGPFTVDSSVVDTGYSQNISYYITEEKGVQTLYISGSCDMPDYTSRYYYVYDEVTESGEYVEATSAPWGAHARTVDKIVIADGITSLSANALLGMVAASSVSLGSGITDIDGSAFSGCAALTTVSLSENNTSICVYDTGFYSADKTELLCVLPGATTLSLPESVEIIKSSAAADRQGLTEVIISSDIVEINDQAFRGCSNLTKVSAKNGYVKLGDQVFENCSGISGLSNLNPSLYYVTEEGIWYCIVDSKAYVTYCPENVIPTLTQIPAISEYGPYPVDGSTSVLASGKSGDIEWYISKTDDGAILYLVGSGVTEDYHYDYDYGYDPEYGEEISISRTSAPWGDYYNEVTGIVVTDGITYLGNYAFLGMRNAKTISIGSGVTGIGNSAFIVCSSLTELTVSDDNQAYIVTDGILYNADKTAILTAISTLTSANLPASVKIINEEAFSNCVNLSDVTINSSVLEINRFAFGNCQNISTFALADSYVTLDYSVFNWRTSASYLGDLEEGLYYVDENGIWYQIVDNKAFVKYAPETASCDITQTPIIESFGPYPVQTDVKIIACGSSGKMSWYIVDEEGFRTLYVYGSGKILDGSSDYEAPWYSYRDTVNAIVIGDELTYIGPNAFYYMPYVESVSIGSSLSGMASSAFGNCDRMMSIHLSENNTTFTVKDNVLYSKDMSTLIFAAQGLDSITVPENVTRISGSAFYRNESLREITFEGDNIVIDDFAFYENYTLSKVNISGAYLSIDSNSFYQCRNLSTLNTYSSGLYYVDDNGVWYVILDELAYVKNCPYGVTVEITETPKIDDIGPYPVMADIRIIANGTDGDIRWYIAEESDLVTLYLTGTGVMEDYYLVEDWYWDSEWETERYLMRTSAPWGNYYNRIRAVNIGDGLTNIGEHAFSGISSLKDVTVGSGVSSIASNAFSSCTSFSSISVSEDNPYLCTEDNIVYDVDKTRIEYVVPRITSATIPETVNTVKENAFTGCTLLENVTLTRANMLLKKEAFSGCTALESITVPEGYITLESDVFTNCGKLSPLNSSSDGLFYVDEDGVWYAILGDVAYISYNPNNVEFFLNEVPEVDGKGPYPVSDKDIVALGKSGEVFWFITGEAGDYTLTVTGDGAMSNYSYERKYDSSLDRYVNSVSAPWGIYLNQISKMVVEPGVTYVGAYSMYGSSSLQSVSIAGTVNNVAKYAFANCTSLSDAYFGFGLKKLDGYSFANCTSLTNLDISDGYLTFGKCSVSGYDEWAGDYTHDYGPFTGCTQLPDYYTTQMDCELYFDEYGAIYTVSDGVAYTACMPIGETEWEWEDYIPKENPAEGFYPVEKCISAGTSENIFWKIVEKDGVTTLYIQGEGKIPDYAEVEVRKTDQYGEPIYEQIGSTAPWSSFYDVIDNAVIGEGITAIGDLAFWGSSISDYSLPDSLKTIGREAFRKNTGIDTLVLPEGVTSLESNAFSDCPDLKSVTLSESLNTTGSYTFSGCSNLEEVIIPNGVTKIGTGTFSNCTALKDVTLPESVTNVDNNAFYGCTSLESFTGTDSLSYIGSGAFRDCTALQNVSNIDKVNSIGAQAFYNCSALTEFKIPDSITTLYNETFSECTSLKNVTIGSGVSDIGDRVFYNCTALEQIEIPANVKQIGEYAFSECTSLNHVTLNEGLTEIKNSAFRNAGLASISVPDSVNRIGSYAFADCDDLETVTFQEGYTEINANAFLNCEKLGSLAAIPKADYVDENGIIYTVTNKTAYVQFCPEGAPIPEYIPDENGTPDQYPVVNKQILYSGRAGENVYWIVAQEGDDKVAYLTGSGPMYNWSGWYDNCWDNANLDTIITKVVMGDGITTIGDSGFGWVRSMKSITIGKDVSSIGREAFDYTTSLNTVYLNAKNLSTVSSDAFERNYLPQNVVVGQSADVLTAAFFNKLPNANITIEKSNYIHLDADLHTGIKLGVYQNLLELGKSYYIDENGAIYEIQGTEAYLKYIPEGMDSFKIPGSFTDENNVTYSVTGVISGFLKEASDLSSLTFEEPELIKNIPDFAFSGCATLLSVNDLNKEEDIRKLFSNASYGFMPFAQTGIATSFGSTEDAIVIKPDDSQIDAYLTISNTDGFNKLTGQYTTTTVSFTDNTAGKYVLRAYIRFSDDSGEIPSHSLGLKEYETSTGHKFSVNLVKTDVPNVYCFELPTAVPGEVFSFSFITEYDSPTTGGGTAIVWGEVENTQTGVIVKSNNFHLLTWDTKEAGVEIAQNQTGNLKLYGDGTENGRTSLHNLSYQFNATVTPSQETLGKNYLTGVTFVDTITLPDSMEWNPSIVDAVNTSGCWSSLTSGTGEPGRRCVVYTKVGGKTVEIASVYFKDYWGSPNISPRVSFVGNQMITTWDYSSSATNRDMSIMTHSMTVYGDVILTTTNLPAVGTSYTINNEIQLINNYAHFSEKGPSATVTSTVIASEKEMNATNFYSSQWTNPSSYDPYTITLSNYGTHHFQKVYDVIDTLDVEMMITPERLQDMFAVEDVGKYLEVTIQNISIHRNDHINDLPDGLNLGNTSYSCVYHGMESEAVGCVQCENLTVTLGWDDAGKLIVHTESYTDTSGNTVSATDYEVNGNMRAVFDSIGLLTDSNTVYTVKWNFGEGIPLWSGQELKMQILCYMKDSFMKSDSDRTGYGSSKNIYNSAFVNYDSLTVAGQVDQKEAKTGAIRHNGTNNISCQYWDNRAMISGDIHKTGGVYNLRVYDGVETVSPDKNPLVLRLTGAQILMVSQSYNRKLEDLGLSTITYRNETYYLLDKPGVYENIYVGRQYAESITVKEFEYDSAVEDTSLEQGQNNYLDTLVLWKDCNLGSGYSFRNIEVFFYPVNEVSDTMMFRVMAEVWAGNHQGRRLYDADGLYHTFLTSENHIVTEKGDTPEEDVLTRYSVIHEDEYITYRTKLICNLDEQAAQVGKPLSVNGSAFYQVLPASTTAWTDDLVSITYAYDSDIVTLENEDAWYLSNNSFGRSGTGRYINWTEDFKIHFSEASEIYIYITVKNPKNEAWQTYVDSYGASLLESQFVLFQPKTDLSDYVYNVLFEPAYAKLVMGVNQTGVFAGNQLLTNTNVDSRRTYCNEDYHERFVEYYVTIYNDGRTRLYVDNLHVQLPEGFTWLYNGAQLTNYKSNVLDDDGDTVSHYRNYGYGELQISFDNKFKMGGGSVPVLRDRYDDYLGGHYLLPNEACTMVFVGIANDEVDSTDIATCTVGLPHRNYNEAGVIMDESTIVGVDRGSIVRNDGPALLLDNITALENYGFDPFKDTTQWLVSNVNVSRGNVIPGISKSVEDIDYRNNIGEGNFAQDSATITWAVRAMNEGTKPLTGYTLTDVVQRSYDFKGSVYLSIEYGKHISGYQNLGTKVKLFDLSSVLGQEGPVKLSTPVGFVEVTHTSCKSAADQLSTISIHFLDDSAAIPEGGSCTLLIDTANVGTNKNQSYSNNAYLTPDSDNWNASMVTEGNLVKWNDKDSVQSGTFVAVTSHFATAAYKSVEEIGPESNSAISTTQTKSIVLHTNEKELSYTLQIKTFDISSETGNKINHLVIVDKLPEEGDSHTFVETEPRYSDFSVSLMDSPNFKITITDEAGNTSELQPDQYLVEYASTAEITEADWEGEANNKWTTDVIGARAFRIIINETEHGIAIMPNSTVTITFDAFVDDDTIVEGEEAWNSFGYFYTVCISDSVTTVNYEMMAEPLKVGVKIASIPHLTVDLVNPQGNPFEAEQQEKFSYIIYKGTDVNLMDLDSTEAIAEALAGKQYTVVDLSVLEGMSGSESFRLSGLYEHTYDATNGQWVATGTPWNWEHRESYTFVQLPIENSDDYAFKSIGGNMVNTFVYHYDEFKQVTIPDVNVRKVWNIDVKTVDYDTNAVLAGAWYGLYSVNANDAYDGEIPAEITSTVPTSLVQDGITYYLADIKESDSNGKILWENMPEANYLLKEVQVPEGYNYNNEIYYVEQPNDVYNNTVNLLVKNKTGFVLPESGGVGQNMFFASGAVLSVAAIYLICDMVVRKKRKPY